MAKYLWRNGRFEDAAGNPMVDPSAPYVRVLPQIMSDIPEYRSPIDGSLIGSRSARRYDLEKNNCREWEPSDSPTGGKLRNERFANKWGQQVSEEYRDLPVNEAFRAGHTIKEGATP